VTTNSDKQGAHIIRAEKTSKGGKKWGSFDQKGKAATAFIGKQRRTAGGKKETVTVAKESAKNQMGRGSKDTPAEKGHSAQARKKA